jgi:uncharacterized membrane protein
LKIKPLLVVVGAGAAATLGGVLINSARLRAAAQADALAKSRGSGTHTEREESPVSEQQTPAGGEDSIDVVGAVVSDGAYTLFVADFSDTDTAWQAYEALKEVEDGRHVAIEGVVVVKREGEGELEIQKATDHSTKRGLTWGIVGGAVLGVLFPPSIIGSAAVLGAGGAAVGKAREVHHKHELADQLEAAIAPGHSGIVALVSDPGAVEIRKALATADAIVEHTVDKVAARDLKAAAKEIESAG